MPGRRLLEALIVLPLTVSYLIVGLGLLVSFNAIGMPKSLLATGIGHVVINLPLCFAIILSQMGAQQVTLERAARDLGATERQVIARITLPILWPALFAAFCLSFTLSWDEFVIAFLLTNFDVTLPVVIWSMLRTGLNPETNAAGTLVFLVSLAFVLLFEAILFRRKR
jgi:spermidine/putrescine transport system permease protein